MESKRMYKGYRDNQTTSQHFLLNSLELTTRNNQLKDFCKHLIGRGKTFPINEDNFDFYIAEIAEKISDMEGHYQIPIKDYYPKAREIINSYLKKC